MTNETTFDFPAAGRQMHALAAELFPVCRSITGEGLRTTLRRIAQDLPGLKVHEVPTGTPAFDWTVPNEWNIRDAWIKDARGNRIVDFRQCNLHVVNYSSPIHRKVPMSELKDHLFTLPDQPDLVPYRTSYYKQTWGFCLSENVRREMTADEYEVCIDSTLAPGSLSYGELVIPGETDDTVLFSCHACHPSLANDNLAGIAVSSFLARHLMAQPRRLTYRFVYLPGTIGSIVWLSRNEDVTPQIKAGLTVTCLGDGGHSTYKKSRRGDAEIDRAVVHVLKQSGQPYKINEFIPYGYDERQYCSPGFNLPVGSFMRTPNGQYPQYHTSADNLELIKPGCLADSLQKLMAVVEVLEHNLAYVNTSPKCEPQLGKRGLYRTTGGTDPGRWNMALLWTLNLSDGQHTLLDIAERADMPFAVIKTAAAALKDVGLLREGHDEQR